MPAWPSTLPPMLVQGYNANDEWSVLETPMESGPMRRTRMSSHFMTTGIGTLMLNKAQMSTLVTALNGAKSGADWFTGMPLDMGGGPVAHRARITTYQLAVVVPGSLWRAMLWWESDERKLA